MRLNRCASSSKSSLVTDPIKVIVIIINYILFFTDNYWGFLTSDIHRSYTQQKKLRKICLRGYNKISKVFKDF